VVVPGSFVVAGGQGFVVLEPVEAALDDVAAVMGHGVEAASALAPAQTAVDLVDPFRDRRFDASRAQVGTVPR
jgi:hypothetical protein